MRIHSPRGPSSSTTAASPRKAASPPMSRAVSVPASVAVAPRPVAAPHAWLVEAALVALVIALLLPLYAALVPHDLGRDGRFAAGGVKDDAMRALMHGARWQWMAFALVGLALLNAHRRGMAPAIGTALALLAWAAVAWVGQVPWPLATGPHIVLAREAALPHAMPAGFVVAMIAVAALVLAASPWIARRLPEGPSVPASVLAYPGLVAATGLGWLVLLDLSANGLAANRYLALYHHGHLWLAMLAFSVVAFWRRPLVRSLAWTLSLVDGAAGRVAARLGSWATAALLAAIAAIGVVAFALLLANTRQLTSEIGRLWLVVGAAWFFFLRGTPLTERLARSAGSFASLLRYTAPLAFVVAVLAAMMVATRDMGPLLVAGYGAGAFVAASLAMWRFQRGGSAAAAYLIAIVAFSAWVVAMTFGLYRFGSLDPVTAARLENVAVPLASANDQVALVTWFQRAAPALDVGPGAVPWCGYGAAGTCSGVPAQIQSDYTFTALVGLVGWAGAWLVTLGITLWLWAIVRAHGRATRGEPRLVRNGARLSNDEQAFASWLAVAWVVLTLCQLAVTVAGNLAVIPLTGVTFPFVSFGMTSLVVNLAMLALAATLTPAGDVR